MRTPLLTVGILVMGAAPLCAQSFFTSPATYLEPAWRGAGGEFSHWDYFYTPYLGANQDGINYPDMDAPFGEGGSAPPGFPVPSNTTAGDPYAFWDTRNPTLAQTGTASAFMAGAIDGAGNIYSFSAPTAYEIADATPFTLGTVVVQWQTAGSLMDFDSLRLVTPGGVEIAPTNFITEYRQGGGAMGGIDNRTAAQWDLTGLNLTGYKISFQAAGSSNSLQELLLDTHASYSEAVPSARTWSAAMGVWSAGGNWSGGSAATTGTVPPKGGNVTFASGTGATIDGGVREVGQLALLAPGAFVLDATGGGSLKVNTGITAKPVGGGITTIFAPFHLGSFNFMDIGASAEVAIAGPVTGNAGFYKFGPGTLRMSGGVSVPGSILLADGSLILGGAASAGEIAISGGARLLVHGSLSGGTLTLNRGTLGGTGTVNRPVTLDAGDVLSPGDDVGMLTTSLQNWAAGGAFRLELADADAGPGLGWDLVNIDGVLTIGATSAARFTLSLTTSGGFVNFNPAQDYLWKFASASGGVSGFDAADFQFETSGFLAPIGGNFGVTRAGNDLFLQYSAVPEPGVGVMCIVGLAIFAVWRNRRVMQGREYLD